MSIPWVCASCRRRLWRGLSSPPYSDRGQTATFISFVPRESHDDDPQDETPQSNSMMRQRPSGRRKAPIRIIPLKEFQSVEDDFIERVLEYRDPSSGPYSNPVALRDSLSATSHGRSVNLQGDFAATESDTRKEDEQPLSWPTFTKPPASPFKPLRSQALIDPFHMSAQLNNPLRDFEQTRFFTGEVPTSDDSSIIGGDLSAAVAYAEGDERSLASIARYQATTNTTRQAFSEMQTHLPATSAAARKLFLQPHTSWEAYLENDANGGTISMSQNIYAFAKKLASDWCQSDTSGTSPTPRDVFGKLSADRDRLIWIRLWREVLLVLLTQIIRRHSSSAICVKRSTEELLMQCVSLWEILLESLGECHRFSGEGLIHQVEFCRDWSTFNESEQMKRLQAAKEVQPPHERLGTFLDPAVRKYLNDVDGLVVALTLWSLHNHHVPSSSEGEPGTKSMQTFLTRVLMGSNMADRVKAFDNIFAKRKVSSADKAYAVAAIRGMTSLTNSSSPEAATTSRLAGRAVKRGSAPVKSDDMVLLDFTKNIGRAVKQQQYHKLTAQWSDATHKFKKAGRSTLPVVLFNPFLTAFMALRDPAAATDVWNTMLAQGEPPSIDHWDAVLKGCGMARDTSSLQVLWDKMIASGIRPDTQAWATRLLSLVNNRQADTAFEAFEDMATSCINASKAAKGPRKSGNTGSPSLPAKPNVQCLNIVIGGLAHGRRYEQVIKALTWMKPLGLKPDIHTYNPLFQSALSAGDVDVASRILQQMQACGIEPSVVTFTMILNSLFRQRARPNDTMAQSHNIEAEISKAVYVSPETRTSVDDKRDDLSFAHVLNSTSDNSAVGAFFSLMAKHSIEPNARTYSTLIKGLLDMPSPNVTAAYTVLRHLTVNSLPLSPQVYISLARFHFKSTPPDLESIEALWQHARAHKGKFEPLTLDNAFFDTFVRGWAGVGAHAKALRAVEEAHRHGRSLSYEVYKTIGSRLQATESRTRALEVVRDVEQQERTGGMRLGDGSRAGFWSWAQRLRDGQGTDPTSTLC